MSKVNMRSVANLVSQNYGSIYTTSGGGRRQIGGVNVREFLRSVLGNRVLDLYLKYAGIKTLTTATLVPFALILGKEAVEELMNIQTGGALIPKNIPLFDHKLVGNYLKLVGISTVKLSLNTLVPLGVLMIVHDLYNNYTQTGGLRRGQQGGARLPLDNTVPSTLTSNIDNVVRGVNIPTVGDANPIYNDNMQQACLTGDCGSITHNSLLGFDKPTIEVRGFPDQLVPVRNVPQRGWAGYSGHPIETNIKYADIYNIPKSMAGGSRELQPSELRSTPREVTSVPISQYGGRVRKTDLYKNYNKYMNSNRNEVVSKLITKWQKLDRQSIPGDLSRYIRKMSKDNRYSNQSILKMFPKTVLLDNFN